MKFTSCGGVHQDTPVKEWADTAGTGWREVECTQCGRLRRERR